MYWTGTTLVDKRYRNTQNVWRFLTEQCGKIICAAKRYSE
ncbi:DUF6434 domain-containing protein [Buttiauxella sp.]